MNASNAGPCQPSSPTVAAQSQPAIANADPLRVLRSDPRSNQEGLELLRRLHGGHSGEQLVASLDRVCPDFVTMTVEWALAGVMGRPGLDLVTRELLLIASCTTLGFAATQLRAHIEAALSIGASREQVVETILQMLFYAGGAATSNALRTAAELFQDHEEAATAQPGRQSGPPF